MNAILLGLATQGELGKIALQAVVAADSTVVANDEEALILGPAQALDGVLIPGDGLQRLTSAAVDIYSGLGGLAMAI